jgi:hypothetical protein
MCVNVRSRGGSSPSEKEGGSGVERKAVLSKVLSGDEKPPPESASRSQMALAYKNAAEYRITKGGTPMAAGAGDTQRTSMPACFSPFDTLAVKGEGVSEWDAPPLLSALLLALI